MTEDKAQPTVAHVPERARYEIRVGDEVAGFAQYIDADQQRIFFHTIVEDKFEGQGLASKLVTFALDDVRKADLRVVPVCPYVKSFLEKHAEYADLADPVTPGSLNVIPS